MLKTDGARKRWGRFFKRDSSLLGKVDIQAYDFKEIMQHPVVTTDNLQANIIHSRLHDPDELFHAIRDDDQILGDLMTAQMRLPVIFPRNFTKEWTEEKKRAHRRNASGNLDEEDLEQILEQEEEEERLAREAQHRYLLARKKKLGEENLTPEELIALQEAEKSLQKKEPKAPSEATAATTATTATTEKVGTPPSPNEEEVSSPTMDNNKEFDSPPDSLAATENDSPELSMNKKTLDSPEAEAPIEEKNFPSTEEDLESVQMSSVNNQTQDSEQEQNFQQGFKMLEKALDRIRHLEKSILERSQENFMLMTKALASSIFGKEISLDPQKFIHVIERAIQDNFGEESIKVHIHPEMKTIMHNAGITDEIETWLEDENIEKFDFKISSEQKSVKSSIQSMVEKMIEELQLELYEDKPEG